MVEFGKSQREIRRSSTGFCRQRSWLPQFTKSVSLRCAQNLLVPSALAGGAGLDGLERQMKRPLLRVTLLFVAGILAASFGFLPLPLLLGLTLGLAGVALAWGRVRAVLLCLLIFLTGWTNLTLRTVVLSPHDLRRIL